MKKPGVVILKSPIAFFLAIAWLALLASCRTAPESADAVSSASPAGRDMPAVAGDIAPVEDGMRVLVVYFSQGSATKRVAVDLAFFLGADTERIIELKKRTGLFGFLSAGADSSMGKATPIETPARDPALYDRVVVCTPVWAWHLAPPVRTWLFKMRGRLPDCVYVVVSADTAPEKIVPMMEEASGKAPIAYAGFVGKDFIPKNRATYVRKLGVLAGKLH